MAYIINESNKLVYYVLQLSSILKYTAAVTKVWIYTV
jgi:hypothetical protein